MPRSTRLRRFWNAYVTMPEPVRIAVWLVLLVCAGAVAADTPYLTGDALQAEIATNCSGGCVTFNQQEAQEFADGIERMMQQREDEAFQRGQADVRARCASLI